MPDKPLPEYVRDLSAAERIQLIKDYEQFRRAGFIGDCALRTLAGQYMPEGSGSIVLQMINVAFEAYRWGYYNSEFYTSDDTFHKPEK